MGFLRGDWYVEGVDARKREELQMIRSMACSIGKGGRKGRHQVDVEA